MVHIYNGMLVSHKKWNLDICDHVNEPRRYYAKWNKSDRERQIPYDSTSIQNLKKQNRNRLIDTENKLMVAKWEGGRGMSVSKRN